jgi:hypothetical protein
MRLIKATTWEEVATALAVLGSGGGTIEFSQFSGGAHGLREAASTSIKASHMLRRRSDGQPFASREQRRIKEGPKEEKK